MSLARSLHLRLKEVWRSTSTWLAFFRPRSCEAQNLLANAVELAAIEAREVPFIWQESQPFFSLVVPVFNTPPAYLNDLLTSFKEQQPGLAELILSDDGSSDPHTKNWLSRHADVDGLVIRRAAENGGIARATNAGLALAQGKWVALIDHDDKIAPFALERMARALTAFPQTQFLYTDEIVTDGAMRPIATFLKPAWDKVLLSGVNYINHFSVYRRERLLELGGLREGFDGSQDYDLVLRYTRDLEDHQILHLPYPAYLWRRDGSSYSATFLSRATANARRALGQHFGSRTMPVGILPAHSADLHRVDWPVEADDWPLVSVIIPNIDSPELMHQVLEGLNARTDYPSLDIIIIDNGSTNPATMALYETQRSGRIPFTLEMKREPFNFSRSINRGLALARGEHVLLLNNDIEVRHPGWLKEMVSCMRFDRTGIVGAKLLYPNGKLQHAGVIVGLGNLAGHWFIEQPADFPGPMARLRVRQSLSAITGATMLISRKCLKAVGPFDEQLFAIAYNDIDYCLRALEKGFRVIWTPFAELTHHESATRGSDEAPEKIARFRFEQVNLKARHGTETYEDRAFNPWYTRDRANPTVVMHSKLPQPRH